MLALKGEFACRKWRRDRVDRLVDLVDTRHSSQLSRWMLLLLITGLSGPDSIIYRPPPYSWNIAECGVKLNSLTSISVTAFQLDGECGGGWGYTVTRR